MKFPRALLVVTGLGFLGLGLLVLVSPGWLTDQWGLQYGGPSAVIEVRATYGGSGLGLGVFFVVSAFRFRWIRAALGAQVCTLGGLGAARLVGLAMAPKRDSIHFVMLAIDLIGALIGMIAFKRAKTLFLNGKGHF